ncbi:hypothetical protein F4777DRAFT_48224 [Nemania sp. FL0916]|nr:hypothetical protein F4777DRAFT_48224 [Nemania sp. FL0916]
MRAFSTAVAICAIGASAVTIPAVREVEARASSAGTWYLVGFQPTCGGFGICASEYAVVGAEGSVPGAPAFALRCNTLTGCTSLFPVPGSDADAIFTISQGPLTITQTFTSGGKNTTATGTVSWNGQSLIASEVPVTVTTS